MANRSSSKHRTTPHFSKLRGRCPGGKLRFKDHRMATDVLHRLQNKADVAVEVTGTTTRAEKRNYYCADCKGYHLTSKAQWVDFTQEEVA